MDVYNEVKIEIIIRGGNRSGQALKGLSLVYDESLKPEPDL